MQGDITSSKLESATKIYADYSLDELNMHKKMYKETIKSPNEGEIVEGQIVEVSKKDVVIDVGLKSEGIISASEFRDVGDLRVGDKVDVFLETIENKNGQVLLSKRKADVLLVWEKLYDSLENESVIRGTIINRVKGGVTVDIGGVEAFLPGSQIDVRPVRDFDILVNQQMDFRVIKINAATQNVIISHKVLVEAEYKKKRDEILSHIKVGMVLEGTVKNITGFGIFVDLGGLDGLVHITDIAWGRVNHPQEVVSIDQVIQVVVIGFDQEKQRVSLGMKQLQDHPWKSIEEKYPIGKKVLAKVVSLTEYGAFLEIEKGVEGLVHVSEISWTQQKNATSLLTQNQEVECVVLNIDKEAMKLSLSIRHAMPNPWLEVEEKYLVGSIYTGTVRNIAEFGVFVELEKGIEGLVHISDLVWLRKVRHPREVVNYGESIEVKVLKVDVENRKISLGRKQVEEDPWVNFETIFKVGVDTKGTIVQVLEKGVVVILEHGVEGFVPKTHLMMREIRKGISTEFKVDDVLPLKVIELVIEARRIVLSVSAYFKDKSEEEIKAYEDLRKGTKATMQAGESEESLNIDTHENLEITKDIKETTEEVASNIEGEKSEIAEDDKATSEEAKTEIIDGVKETTEEVASSIEGEKSEITEDDKATSGEAKTEIIEDVKEKSEEVKSSKEENKS